MKSNELPQTLNYLVHGCNQAVIHMFQETI